MGDTYTIELATPDAGWSDESIKVELEELGFLDRLRFLSKCPDSIREAAGDMSSGGLGEIPEDMPEYINLLLGEVSDFEPELYEELGSDAQRSLLYACSNVLAGEEPQQDYEYDPGADEGLEDALGDLELDDDGTLDPDDWR